MKLLKDKKVPKAIMPGVTMVAGVGACIYESVARAAEGLVVWEKEYSPKSENFDKYTEIKEQWQEVYANQLTLVDRELTQSMWKAPGV